MIFVGWYNLLLPALLTFVDLDECRLMPGACQNGRCINTLGSYRCLCNPGYQVDSGRESQCIDVDECQVITPSPCEFECRNTPGSFTCTCPSGFRLDGDGRTCLDVDECELNSTKTGRSICPHSCVNTRGSFECNCNSGFRKNGKQCAGQSIAVFALIYLACHSSTDSRQSKQH